MDRLIKITAILLIFTMDICVFGQINKFDQIPNEEIYVHTNTELLVTGETLYYKIYNFNTVTNKLSNISKIAYIMLINDSKKIMFTQKLKLEFGQSNSDFFIPTNFKTGHYKLITYTKWMDNNNEKPFSYLDIYIVNPFLKSNKKQNKLQTTDSLVLKNNKKEFRFIKRVKTREKVVLNLANFIDYSITSNFSISVKKVDSVKVIKNKTKNNLKTYNNAKFQIPEIRGEIFSGIVTSKTDNQPVKNVTIGLSISNNKIFRNVKTNKQGEFIFSVAKPYKKGKLIVQILDENSENYQIKFNDFSFEKSDKLIFKNLYLNPNVKNWLLQKSINNQIENSYVNHKKDSIITYNNPISFYNKSNFVYHLDDYTRFNTVEETFVEVIEGASIRKKKEKRVIYVNFSKSGINKAKFNSEPLILIDGIVVTDQEILINYDVSKIKTIKFLSEAYIYNYKLYESIVDVETYKGDYLPSNNTIFQKNINNVEIRKVYYSPKYKSNTTLKRIPDYRTQLLWLSHNKNEKEIQFYTSDIKGVYEIVLEGYSTNKTYIKKTNYILVE